METIWLPWQNLLTFSIALKTKTKALQPSTHAFHTKGNSNKNAKKKQHNVDKREVLQAHATQVQIYKMNLNHWRPNLLI
jgi:hypothetical protein